MKRLRSGWTWPALERAFEQVQGIQGKDLTKAQAMAPARERNLIQGRSFGRLVPALVLVRAREVTEYLSGHVRETGRLLRSSPAL